jgi:hypothetical protein
MEAVTAVAGAEVIMAAAIVVVDIMVVVTATISAAGIMAAAIFMPDRRIPVHSQHTVHSPRIA